MPSQNLYRKLVLRNHQITGVLLYGDAKDALWYQQLLDSGQNIGDMVDTLIFGEAYTLDVVHLM